MNHTASTITWGFALVVAAIVLNATNSIPWAIATCGLIALLIAAAAWAAEDSRARLAKDRTTT